MGMPMAEGLRLAHNTLVGAGVRDRIKLVAAGKVYNGFSLVRTLANGAELCNAARAFMFSMGCIQALKCNQNTCPTGLTTQDPRLNSGVDITNKSVRVNNFHRATVDSAAEIIAAMGLTRPEDVTGEHLWKRENGIHVKSYSDMHTSYLPILEKNQLIDGTAKGKINEWWNGGKELMVEMGD